MYIHLELTEIDICAIHDLTTTIQDRLMFVEDHKKFVTDKNVSQDLKEQLDVLMKIEKAL